MKKVGRKGKREKRASDIKNFCIKGAAALLFLGILTAPSKVILAHGFGTSIEVVEGKYLADIGYDAFLIEAQTPVRFDFGLFSSDEPWRSNNDGTFTSNSAYPADFDNIWVRIEEGASNNRTIFATGIRQPSFGPTTMLFSFPKDGVYTMHVRYQNADDEKIAEMSTPIFVEKSEQSESSKNLLFSLLFALLAGGVVGYLIREVRKK